MPRLRTIDHIASAYLADHASNPVDWWTWGADALAEAKRRDVPIFLSIGYAACHWCHVMAHESFEDETVAAYLNEHFVAIKVDREERPDVDQLYMAATQLVSGHGGWPMSVFLLPDGRPFTAGTYYPPVARGGHVSFTDLLVALAGAWDDRRAEVITQAEAVQRALGREVAFIDYLVPRAEALDLDAVLHQLRSELVEATDEHGGQGAPRFPRPSYVEALLGGNRDARDAARVILDAMSRQGLYDHVTGGFARYSVDSQWHVPHFEQMLSDQALLAHCYLLSARLPDADPQWRDVGLATLEHTLEAFRVPGGFASSLDADAGGHEGSHVTWTVEEVRRAFDAAGVGHLTEDVCRRLRIVTPGLFEGRSIPRLADDEPFLTPESLAPAFDALRRARSQRPQPARDEKVILEWNAMLAKSLLTSGDERYLDEGLRLLAGLSDSHFADGLWWRTEQCQAHATAADVAWLLDATLEAFEATGDDAWRQRSRDLAEYLLEHHWDGERPTATSPDCGRGLFSQSNVVTDLFTATKEIFDGATPSSHAVATRALARLALVDGDPDTHAVALRLVTIAAELIATHPRAVVDLVGAARWALDGVAIVVPGDRGVLADHVRSIPMERSVLITGHGGSPLLAQRSPGLAYACRNGVCQMPVDSVTDLMNAVPGGF